MFWLTGVGLYPVTPELECECVYCCWKEESELNRPISFTNHHHRAFVAYPIVPGGGVYVYWFPVPIPGGGGVYAEEKATPLGAGV